MRVCEIDVRPCFTRRAAQASARMRATSPAASRCVCGAWRVTIVCVGFVPNRVKHVLPQRFYSAGNLSHHRRRHRVAKAGANIVCPEPGCGQVCRAHAAGEALVCSRQSAVVFRPRLLGDYG